MYDQSVPTDVVVKTRSCPGRAADCTSSVGQNAGRHPAGAVEWTKAECKLALQLYHVRLLYHADHGARRRAGTQRGTCALVVQAYGGLAKWKPIADGLARCNADGALNEALAARGMTRSNNACMNKIKELMYQEGTAPRTVRRPFRRSSCRLHHTPAGQRHPGAAAQPTEGWLRGAAVPVMAA